MVEVSGLKKAYGPVQALEGIDFTVGSGEVVALLGPNGAGKSTAIRILTGYLQPDEGTVRIDGLDVLTHRLEVQARIGYLPENAPLYPELSVQAYLQFVAEMREIPEAERLERIAEAVTATGLEDQLTRPIGQLSRGYRQRVGIAQAILHRPKLLILDEPTVGLDPTQILEIRSLIRRLAKQSTILFSTHILPEVEAVCDRAIILMNGRVRADANLADLAATNTALLVLDAVPEGAEESLRRLSEVVAVEPYTAPDGRPGFRVHGHENADLTPALFQLAKEADWPVRELRREVRTLETVFNELAQGV